jgi:hypothetical protein
LEGGEVMSKEKFRELYFEFKFTVNKLKEIADERYGDGNHNYARTPVLMSIRKKIGIESELRGGAKTNPEIFSG